jgi:Phage integrase, N-terminal SAM-like domain
MHPGRSCPGAFAFLFLSKKFSCFRPALPPCWAVHSHFWKPGHVLAPDGTLNRVRRSVVLGTLKEIPTRRHARILVDARLCEINRGLHRPRSCILFGEFISSLWVPTILPTLEFSTRRNYQHLTRRHLLPVFGDQPLSDIERVQVQGFVN